MIDDVPVCDLLRNIYFLRTRLTKTVAKTIEKDFFQVLKGDKNTQESGMHIGPYYNC